MKIGFLKKKKKTNTCSVSYLSPFIWELSLGQDRTENRLFINDAFTCSYSDRSPVIKLAKTLPVHTLTEVRS